MPTGSSGAVSATGLAGRHPGRKIACPVSSRSRAILPATRTILSYTPAIGGGRAGMIETASREECAAGPFGELVMLGAAVEVGSSANPVEGAAWGRLGRSGSEPVSGLEDPPHRRDAHDQEGHNHGQTNAGADVGGPVNLAKVIKGKRRLSGELRKRTDDESGKSLNLIKHC